MAINRLSTELLDLVFQLRKRDWVDTSTFPSVADGTNVPLQLSHVCHRWRSIVLDKPQLWQHRLIRSCKRRCPDVHDAEALERATNLRRLFDDRSGRLLPCVIYRYIRREGDIDQNFGPCACHLQYIGEDLVPRAVELTLIVNTWSVRVLASFLPVHDSPDRESKLEYLNVCFDESVSVLARTGCSPSCGTVAPCLQHAVSARLALRQKLPNLTCNLRRAQWTDAILHHSPLTARALSLPYNRLIHLGLNMATIPIAIEIILAADNLEKLWIANLHGPTDAQPEGGQHVRPDTHRRLKSLSFTGHGDLDALLDRLHLPALQSLSVKSGETCEYHLDKLRHLFDCPAAQMRNLELASVVNNELSQADVIHLLSSPPLSGLTSLKLDFPEQGVGDELFEQLTVGLDPALGGRSGGPLFPRLQAMQLTCGSFTDGHLGRMLESRLRGRYQYPLAEVFLFFMEEDILIDDATGLRILDPYVWPNDCEALLKWPHVRLTRRFIVVNDLNGMDESTEPETN